LTFTFIIPPLQIKQTGNVLE